jgi:RHS repeat-associated protein
VWSYPNVHGDVMATADASGVKQGATRAYTPFGAPIFGVADNSAGGLDYAWLGSHQRGFEQLSSVNTIEMGARVYVPGFGRFLQVDPVEGGSANDYDYVNGEPVNGLDLDGRVAGFDEGPHLLVFCMFRAKRCSTSGYSLKRRAFAATERYGKKYGWTERQKNAFLHAFWMATIAKRYGVGFAVGLGQAREADAWRADSSVDLSNNPLGAAYGRLHRTWSDERLARGLADIVSNFGGGYNYNDW